jgi:hypothetical protein
MFRLGGALALYRVVFCVTGSQRQTNNSKNDSGRCPCSGKSNSWNLRAMKAFGVAVIATLVTIPEGRAELQNPVLPRLSVPKARFFQNNPVAWDQFISQLPLRPAGTPQATPQTSSPTSGGKWQPVKKTAPGALSNPLLLTDGTVIAHTPCTSTWYKLTPDITGSYVNGTWAPIAPLPKGYDPQYFASAVLPDGRVIVEGGENNNSTFTCAGTDGHGKNAGVWTSLGAIYDPNGNTWTQVLPPDSGANGWTNTIGPGTGNCNGGIGDAASIVVPNGTFMLSASCAKPAVDALFNATTLGWNDTGAPTDPCVTCNPFFFGSFQNEQGYMLLQNGKVLTIDVWDPQNAQTYDPATQVWTSIASLPVDLTCSSCNMESGGDEIGPAITRPDGTVVAFGAQINTPDPIAIYTPSSNTWIPSPSPVQAICGSNGTTNCTLADAPAALLPNGNILFGASEAYGAPTVFFEFTAANAINHVSPAGTAGSSPSFYYNFLVLPSGEVLETDNSSAAEIYIPTHWCPVNYRIASTG